MYLVRLFDYQLAKIGRIFKAAIAQAQPSKDHFFAVVSGFREGLSLSYFMVFCILFQFFVDFVISYFLYSTP